MIVSKSAEYFRRNTKNFRFLRYFCRHQSTTTINTSLETKSLIVDNKEIEHHSKLAEEWWNQNGILRALHAMNLIRVPFIRDGLVATNITNPNLIESSKVLEGVNILEVGCGGGILTEQLGRLNANVIGIDLGKEVIATAIKHLAEDNLNLSEKIKYKVESIEEHASHNSEIYDAVVLSEVIEHVTEKTLFLKSCVQTLKPGGSIFITTPNRTLPSWLGGIVLAENVLNIVPKGTHDWDKFISPLELRRILISLNCKTILTNGAFYKFWNNSWCWTNGTDFCYALQAVKIND